MRKRDILSLAMIACLVCGGMAFAEADDITLHKQCRHCGMDRGMFNYSRMLIEFDDGSIVAVCSIHCAAIGLAITIDKKPKSIQVADFKGKQLIDAEKTFWLIGGNKPGVMSKRGKWAFEKMGEAEDFLKINQGKISSFEDAMKAAYEDMYEDTKLIRERRQAKRMKMMMDQTPPSRH